MAKCDIGIREMQLDVPGLSQDDPQRRVQIVSCKGEVDLSNLELLTRYVDERVKKGFRCFVLDAADLTYIASAGLGAIAILVRRLRGEKGDLRLAALRRSVRSIVEILGLHKVIRCFGELESAVQSYAHD